MTIRTAVVPPEMRRAQSQFMFSPGVRVGEFLVISGQIGWDGQGNAIADPEAQYVAAFENVGKVLTSAGMSFANVVDIDSFHTSLDDLQLFMDVKARYFNTEPYPAWTAVGVAALTLPGLRVEIKCTATDL